MRLTVSLTSDAMKKMMTPSWAGIPGIALSAAMKPAALAMKERTSSRFVMPSLSHEKREGWYHCIFYMYYLF